MCQRGQVEDGAWIAEVPELPGCMADGRSRQEAIRAAERAAKLWLEVARDDGREIPEPSEPGEASGKFIVRIPRSLHRRLQILAKREQVSLNQLVSNLLAQREVEARSRG